MNFTGIYPKGFMEISLKKASLKTNLSIFILLTLALLLTALIGCGPEVAPEEEEVEAPTSFGVEVAMAEEVEVTAVPTSTPAAITETMAVDYCLDCHTNKEMLIDTADPEEEVISENEGEG